MDGTRHTTTTRASRSHILARRGALPWAAGQGHMAGVLQHNIHYQDFRPPYGQTMGQALSVSLTAQQGPGIRAEDGLDRIMGSAARIC